MRTKVRKRSWIILCIIGGIVVLGHNMLNSEPSTSASLPLPEDVNNIPTPDPEAIAAVELIMSHTGLPANFEIMASDSVENAAAVTRRKDGEVKRTILYNRSFMDSVRMETKSNLAKTFVLAHEIGHHLSGHTLHLDTLMSSQQHAMELEADKFASFLLFRLGATLEQAEIVIQKMADDLATATHPAKEDRLRAIREGWFEAQALTGEEMATQSSPSNETIEAVEPVESTKASATIAGAAAKFHEIKVTQFTTEVRIAVPIDLTNLKDHDCIVTAWFFDDSGQPLRDLNQKYRTRSGGVATSVVVRPSTEQVRQLAITLVIPISELHLRTDQHRVIVYLGLSIADTKFSASSTGLMFFAEN